AGPFTQVRWTAIDLSPALIAAQRRRAQEPSQPAGRHLRWSGLRADCLQLPLASHSVDGLILANEVIADLPVESGRNTGAIRVIALKLPPLGSPRWPDASAPAGFAQLFRALILRQP